MTGSDAGASRRASFRAARTFTIATTTAVWAVLLWLIGSALGDALGPAVSAAALGVSLAAIAPLVGLIAAQGVVTGMLDGFTRGRFEPPPPADMASSRNPWTTGAMAALATLPVAAVAAGLASGLSAPVTAGTYVSSIVTSGTIVVLCASTWASGAPLAREIAAAGTRWAGSFAAYRLWRHALPSGALNLVANGLVAVALTPPSGHASADRVVPDAVIATLIVAGAVSFGARNVARTDARAGFVSWAVPPRSRGLQALLVAGLALVGGGIAWAVCLPAAGLPLAGFVALKGLWSGALAFAFAWVAAGWGAAEVAQRESVAVVASQP